MAITESRVLPPEYIEEWISNPDYYGDYVPNGLFIFGIEFYEKKHLHKFMITYKQFIIITRRKTLDIKSVCKKRCTKIPIINESVLISRLNKYIK